VGQGRARRCADEIGEMRSGWSWGGITKSCSSREQFTPIWRASAGPSLFYTTLWDSVGCGSAGDDDETFTAFDGSSEVATTLSKARDVVEEVAAALR
jgi:hypothetical protein